MLASGVSLEISLVAILIHTGIFLLLMFVVNGLILRPLSKLHLLRREATAERLIIAEKVNAKSERLEVECQVKIDSALRAAREAKDKLRQEGFTKANEIMHEARAHASLQIEQAREQLLNESAIAKGQLTTDARNFAQLISERLLERKVQTNDDDLDLATQNYA